MPPSYYPCLTASAHSLSSLLSSCTSTPFSPQQSHRSHYNTNQCGLLLCSEPSDGSHFVSIKVSYQHQDFLASQSDLTTFPTSSPSLSPAPTLIQLHGLLYSLNTPSVVAPQDLGHYCSFCLEPASPRLSNDSFPQFSRSLLYAPSSERSSLTTLSQVTSHPLFLLYFSCNPITLVHKMPIDFHSDSLR